LYVTPNDCKTCHNTEAEQYAGSKKAFALDNLQKNPVYHALVETIVSTKGVKENKIVRLSVSEDAKNQTCYACHGTQVMVKGKKKLSTPLGDIEVPELTNWPNQGVGRLNPDGSHGACTSCHPRHGFSLKVARKPYTCGECHLEPDIPAYNVYKESKHGNIYSSLNAEWNFDAVPWTAGKDFRAPTCAVCHNSLLTNGDGEVIAQRSHDFAPGSGCASLASSILTCNRSQQDLRDQEQGRASITTTFTVSSHLRSSSIRRSRQETERNAGCARAVTAHHGRRVISRNSTKS
jgi:hypothetical protein